MLESTIIENVEVRDFLAKSPLEFFVGGRWLASSEAKTFRTYDPGTGELLPEVYEASPTDVERAVGAAADVFREQGWSRLAPKERAVYLHHLADLV
jgi:acyl-CoA reductase-like NAD-dependent aldehyde dehydrogenase